MQGHVVKPVTLYDPGKVLIAPSLLAADFSRLGEEVRDIASGGADFLHLDVMDGHFVPNLSMGPGVISSLRPVSDLLFDVHLMLSEPGRYIDSFVRAGADSITIHVESSGDLCAVLSQIHSQGCSAGITLRPGTPACSLLPYLPLVDLVLVMTVEPGFGGQSFMPGQLGKIRYLHDAIAEIGRPIHLEVDGGIGVSNASTVLSSGANVLVAGSSVFHAGGSRGDAIRSLRCGK